MLSFLEDTADQKIETRGNFITRNNPSISQLLAVGNLGAKSTTLMNGTNPVTHWPAYTNAKPFMMNLNETGGIPYETVGTDNFAYTEVNVTEYKGPGLRNDISLVNAYLWEGGRGVRCDFWRSMGVLIPE